MSEEPSWRFLQCRRVRKAVCVFHTLLLVSFVSFSDREVRRKLKPVINVACVMLFADQVQVCFDMGLYIYIYIYIIINIYIYIYVYNI